MVHLLHGITSYSSSWDLGHSFGWMFFWFMLVAALSARFTCSPVSPARRSIRRVNERVERSDEAFVFGSLFRSRGALGHRFPSLF